MAAESALTKYRGYGLNVTKCRAETDADRLVSCMARRATEPGEQARAVPPPLIDPVTHRTRRRRRASQTARGRMGMDDGECAAGNAAEDRSHAAGLMVHRGGHRAIRRASSSAPRALSLTIRRGGGSSPRHGGCIRMATLTMIRLAEQMGLSPTARARIFRDGWEDRPAGSTLCRGAGGTCAGRCTVAGEVYRLGTGPEDGVTEFAEVPISAPERSAWLNLVHDRLHRARRTRRAGDIQMAAGTGQFDQTRALRTRSDQPRNAPRNARPRNASQRARNALATRGNARFAQAVARVGQRGQRGPI